MKQFVILFIAIATLIISINCVSESSDQKTSLPTQNYVVDIDAPVKESEEALVIDKEISKIIFSASPIDIVNIESIVALGNLNPPSHVFPTDHIYIFITRREDINLTKEVTLYSPGSLTVTRVNAIEQLKAGITDYSIEFTGGEDLHIRLGHVTSLSENVFGDTVTFKSWRKTNEYSTGGETYRWWSKDYNLKVEAGQIIGMMGGNPNQWALDLFVYDLEQTQTDVANPERWEKTWYLNAVDPLCYYEDEPVFKQLKGLIKRELEQGEEPPFGSVLQDVPGTAQGCWFLDGVSETYPEDPHLALVHDNKDPELAVFSIGNSIKSIQADIYVFLPNDSGLLNRDFKDIKPDSHTYGFNVKNFDGIIIVHLPDSETLWIEALPGVGVDPDLWLFSEDKTIFKR